MPRVDTQRGVREEIVCLAGLKERLKEGTMNNNIVKVGEEVGWLFFFRNNVSC